MTRLRDIRRIGLMLAALALSVAGCASSRNKQAAALADSTAPSTASTMAQSSMDAISNGTKTVMNAGKEGAQSMGRWITGGSQTNQISLVDPLDSEAPAAGTTMAAARPSAASEPLDEEGIKTVVAISSSSKDTTLVVPSSGEVAHDLAPLDLDEMLARETTTRPRTRK